MTIKRRYHRLSQASDRGICPRKWTVSGAFGPVFLAAEYVTKKLVQHRWPCRFEPIYDRPQDPTDDVNEQGYLIAAKFVPFDGSYFVGDFYDALALSARVVSHERKIDIHIDRDYLTLAGEHYITPRGQIRRGIAPAPF